MQENTNKLKLLFIFLNIITVIAIFSICFTGYWAVSKLTGTLKISIIVADATQNHMESDMMHDAIRADILKLMLNSKLNEPIDEPKKELKEHIATFNENIEKNKKLDLPSEVKKLLDDVTPVLDRYSAAANSVAQSAEKGGFEEASKEINYFYTMFEEVEEKNAAVSEAISVWGQSQIAEGSFASKASEIILLLLAVAIVILALSPIFTIKKILNPLKKVNQILGSLSQGDFTSDLEFLNRNDEIGEIATSINVHIEKMSTTLSKIKNIAASVFSASQEISSGSLDLSARTEQQASSLEETSATMEEVTSAVKQTSESALNADKLAIKAKDNAEEGGKVVDVAVNAMSNIEKSSQKISEIITVIDEIAFQTNLLALNAAVEAARAGEAGKGFAVVAAEVRSLAGRSAAASKEIKELIKTSADQVTNGASLVNKAGESLKNIMISVNEVAEIITDIATASNQQALSIEGINSAISDMDEMTQQNAALVEENSAASSSLVDQVNELNSLISFFKLNKENNTNTVMMQDVKKLQYSKNEVKSNSYDNTKNKSAKISKYENQDSWQEF